MQNKIQIFFLLSRFHISVFFGKGRMAYSYGISKYSPFDADQGKLGVLL